MGEPKPEPSKEVIKHSAAIQIENNITLLQRRAWNVLLYHAYDALPMAEVHHIPVKELTRILEYISHNEEYLKEALRALVSCRVEWNVLDKDGEKTWGVAPLLAGVEMKNGMCAYAYSPFLRERLHNPRMYARLDLSLQNRFTSKHAQALWELCADYLGAAREYGETPFIAVEEFRKLIAADDSYQSFKKLNQRVIKPALGEINRISDFRVTVEHRRQGRKVVALKFKIRRVPMLPHVRQATLFPDLDDTPTVVKLLTDAGLAHRDAFEVWQEGFAYVEAGKRPADGGDNPDEALVSYVKEKIHLLHQRREAGKVSNPAGFLLTALKKNYGNAKLEQEAKGRARKRQAAEVSRLEAQKRQVTRDMEDALHALAGRIIETLPELLDEAVAALQAENNSLMSRYDARKLPLNNFRDSAAVTIAISQWLEHRFPKRFAKTRQPFSKQLAGITARLEELAGRKAAG